MPCKTYDLSVIPGYMMYTRLCQLPIVKDHFCAFRKESRYKNTFAQIDDFNKLFSMISCHDGGH